MHELLHPDGVENWEESHWTREILRIVGFGFVAGAVMGGFNLRLLQCLFSGIKIPILLLFATLICIPNLVIVATLLGLRQEVRRLVHALLRTQATVAVTLASLSPLTILAYLSTRDYAFAVAWNGFCFLLATLAGQLVLSRSYAPLIARNPKHRVSQRSWVFLVSFVTIQLAWILRPFIGFAGLETRFFREHAWDNAYVVVFRTVLRALGL